MDPSADPVSSVEHRVNYSETDQMGFVYHGNYLVWLDIARTEHLRRTGVTYKDMEERGVFLAVTEARIRYRLAARYDDVVRIRCWVRDLASRRVVFGYAVERAGTAEILATAETSLIALDRRRALSRVPADVTERLHAIPDPVRL
ncbi:MAG TPA: thioesterase family protein [Gemmatimonadales bacterium]|nr:thioesterase family protein [Gemmatimonadales bacterium]